MSLTRTLSVKSKSQLESDEKASTEILLKRNGVLKSEAKECTQRINAIRSQKCDDSEILRTKCYCDGDTVSKCTVNADAEIIELKSKSDNNVTIDSAIEASPTSTKSDPAATQPEVSE